MHAKAHKEDRNIRTSEKILRQQCLSLPAQTIGPVNETHNYFSWEQSMSQTLSSELSQFRSWILGVPQTPLRWNKWKGIARKFQGHDHTTMCNRLVVPAQGSHVSSWGFFTKSGRWLSSNKAFFPPLQSSPIELATSMIQREIPLGSC